MSSSDYHSFCPCLPASSVNKQSRTETPAIDPQDTWRAPCLPGAWRLGRLPGPPRPLPSGQGEGSGTAGTREFCRVPHPLGFDQFARAHSGELTELFPLNVGKCMKYKIPIKIYLLQKLYHLISKPQPSLGRDMDDKNE